MTRIAIVAIATLLATTSADAAGKQKLAAWQKEALQKVKSEKTVLDAKWRMAETNVLWAAMAPDGSRRDGFAEMLCMILMEAGPTGEMKSVWIYDPVSYESGGAEMGMAVCR